jgi:hypothetical protein
MSKPNCRAHDLGGHTSIVKLINGYDLYSLRDAYRALI